MSFAALETRINAVALSRLGNATASIAGGDVAGTFDAEYQEVLGLGTAQPAFAGDAAALADVVRNTALTITCAPLGLVAAPYIVAEVQQEHGITRLLLRRLVA
jgi:hypothetical protein